MMSEQQVEALRDLQALDRVSRSAEGQRLIRRLVIRYDSLREELVDARPEAVARLQGRAQEVRELQRDLTEAEKRLMSLYEEQKEQEEHA